LLSIKPKRKPPNKRRHRLFLGGEARWFSA
jgi:hypothetical protein